MPDGTAGVPEPVVALEPGAVPDGPEPDGATDSRLTAGNR